MALIECIECKKQHTDTIESCPHCGFIRKIVTAPKKHDMKKMVSDPVMRQILGIIAIIAIVVIYLLTK